MEMCCNTSLTLQRKRLSHFSCSIFKLKSICCLHWFSNQSHKIWYSSPVLAISWQRPKSSNSSVLSADYLIRQRLCGHRKFCPCIQLAEVSVTEFIPCVFIRMRRRPSVTWMGSGLEVDQSELTGPPENLQPLYQKNVSLQHLHSLVLIFILSKIVFHVIL